MSQQKVDRYKENKANRAAIMKKQKVTRRLQFIVVIAVVAAAVVWFGVSVYNSTKQTETAENVYVDSEDVVTYMNDPEHYSPAEETTEEAAEETSADSAAETAEDAAVQTTSASSTSASSTSASSEEAAE